MMTSESHMKSNFDYKKDRSPELFIIKLTNLFQKHKTPIINNNTNDFVLFMYYYVNYKYFFIFFINTLPYLNK